MQSTKRYQLGILYLIGIIAISFSAIFIKWSEAEVSVIAMYRLYLTNLLLLPFIWKYKGEIAQLKLAQWGYLGLSGIALGLHFLLWMGSLRFTTVASSTVILTLEPILVMLGSFWLFRLRPNKAMFFGIIVAFIGSVAVGAGDFRLSGSALLGDLLSFFSVVSVAVHVLIGKRLRESVSAFVYNFFIFAFAASALALYNGVNHISIWEDSQKEWGLFLLLALVPTLFGHYLFNWLLKYISATRISSAVLGEPLVASILAWQLLGENIAPLQMISGAFILIGVWLFIQYGKETKEEQGI